MRWTSVRAAKGKRRRAELLAKNGTNAGVRLPFCCWCQSVAGCAIGLLLGSCAGRGHPAADPMARVAS